MRVLGISAFYHDSAAALVQDGDILAAAQEERFTRKKHDAGFPAEAVKYCLKAAGLGIDQIDVVASVVSRSPPHPLARARAEAV
jgi:carbamoyltransferase